MSLLTLALSLNGLAGFAGGAFLYGLGQATAGTVLMGAGLALQIAALVRLKRARRRNEG